MSKALKFLVALVLAFAVGTVMYAQTTSQPKAATQKKEVVKRSGLVVAKYDGNELLRAAKAVIEGQQYMSRSIRERYSHGSEPASGCHKS